MTEPKYYVPSIGEFRVGFEYEEFAHNEKWAVKYVTVFDLYDINRLLETGDIIRVRHLDREGIEACGWEYQGANSYKFGDYYWLIADGQNIEIEQGNGVDFVDADTIYNGTILNRSELIFQMDRLGIKK